MSEADDWHPSCYDCEREIPQRHLQPTEVIIHHDEGLGYDWVPVPMCGDCRRRRYGYDCPQCGCTYDSEDDAMFCCRRRPGEAPDCPECGRRMERGAWGYSPDGGPTVEWATCECCPVTWGRFTGWHQTDDEPCKHVETDPRGDGA